MKALPLLFLCLFCISSHAQKELTPVKKDSEGHYGIVQQNNLFALYNFSEKKLITELADVKIIMPDSGFFLVFDKTAKNFRLFHLRNGIELSSRPTKKITVYSSGSETLGITGLIVNFDTMAAQGGIDFPTDPDHDIKPEEIEFSPNAICKDYVFNEGRRTPWLRFSMVDDQSLLVEHSFLGGAGQTTDDDNNWCGTDRAWFQVYNFSKNTWSRKELGVLDHNGNQFEFYQFRLDSALENNYGDEYYGYFYSPSRLCKIYFSDENGIVKSKPYSYSKSSLQKRCAEKNILSGNLVENYSPGRIEIRDLWGVQPDRLARIAAKNKMVYHPHPNSPAIYWEEDSLFIEGYDSLRYALNGKTPAEISWIETYWKNQVWMNVYVKDNRYVIVRFREPDEMLVDSSKLDWVKKPIHRYGLKQGKGKSGIYDMTTKNWVIDTVYDDVSIQNGYFITLKNGLQKFDEVRANQMENEEKNFSYFINGELTIYDADKKLIARSKNYPFYEDAFAVIYKMDSITMYNEKGALCHNGKNVTMAGVYSSGTATIPVYDLFSEKTDTLIPLVALNPGSYISFHEGEICYTVYENRSRFSAPELIHLNRFEFKTTTAFSGFRHEKPFNYRSELATDDYQPRYLDDIIYFTTTHFVSDPDQWGAEMIAGVHLLSDDRAIIHNKQLKEPTYGADEVEVSESAPVFNTRRYKAGIYRSGWYRIPDHRWLIPPVYERFIIRHDGITAIERKDKTWMPKPDESRYSFSNTANENPAPADPPNTFRYADYTPDFRLKEIVNANGVTALKDLKKEYLLYPAFRVDSIIRGPQFIKVKQGVYVLNPNEIYKSGNKFGIIFYEDKTHSGYPFYWSNRESGTFEFRNKCTVNPPYDALSEFAVIDYIAIDGDSVRIRNLALPLAPMKIRGTRTYSDNVYYEIIRDGDTAYYTHNYLGVHPTEKSNQSYFKLSSEAYITNNQMVVCNFPLTFEISDRYVDFKDWSNEKDQATTNNSAFWLKGANGYTNVAGQGANLQRLTFGYFNSDSSATFIPFYQPDQLAGPGKFYDLDGNELKELTDLKITKLEEKEYGYIFYYNGGLGILSKSGKVLGKGPYQYVQQEGNRVLLGETNKSGVKIKTVDNVFSGLWIELEK